MSYLLGIDLGTNGLKCAIYDEVGNSLATSRQTYGLVSSRRGWAEQDPNRWWIAAQDAIRECISRSGIDPKDINGVSQCGFHHCPVFLDKNGRVLRNSIVTHDIRTIESWKSLKNQGVVTELQKITGSAVGTCHFPPIFHWIKKHDSNSVRKCTHILMPKDFLGFRLTGKIGTDFSDATGMHLIDPISLDWSEDLLEMVGVLRECLPKIHSSTEIVGEITREAADVTGLKSGIPVVTGGGDTHCALLGMGVVNGGQAGMMVGTSAVIRACFNRLAPDKKGRCYLQHHVVPGIWCNAASIFSGCFSLEWAVQNFGLLANEKTKFGEGSPYTRLTASAAQAPPGCEGLIFHPFLFGRRTPYYNPGARGTFFNISYWHKTPHFLRSVLEGVGYAMKTCLEIIREVQAQYGDSFVELRAGGGGIKLPLWRQILADILETKINITDNDEVGTLGAAMLAGTGLGTYKNISDAINKCVRLKESITPSPKTFDIYRKNYNVWNELYYRVEPLFAKLA